MEVAGVCYDRRVTRRIRGFKFLKIRGPFESDALRVLLPLQIEGFHIGIIVHEMTS